MVASPVTNTLNGMSKYIQRKESGLFDKAARLEELHELGDPIARLDEVMAWTLFETVSAYRLPKSKPKGPGGRPAFCPQMMFKVLVIANLYKLSDLQLEFPTTDRLRFKRFLGLSAADQSPAEKTFSAFHETLTLHGLIGPLFGVFHAPLHSVGMSAQRGK